MVGRGEGEAVEVDWDGRGVPFADVDDQEHDFEDINASFMLRRFAKNTLTT